MILELPHRTEIFCFVGPDASNDFFTIMNTPSYEDGPDPVMQVDQSNDLVHDVFASLCLFTREKLIPCLQKYGFGNDWSSIFSSAALCGKSAFTAACLDYFRRQHCSGIELFFHDVGTLFSINKCVGHVFQIAKAENRLFIVDLSIRQFIDKNLRLRPDEAVVIDALLKDGFVELTPETYLTYYNFFASYTIHHERQSGLYNNYPEWYLYKLDANNLC